MQTSRYSNSAILLITLGVALSPGLRSVCAQTSITTVNTFTSPGTPSTQSVTGAVGGGPEFTSTTTYTVNYAGDTLGINSFTTGAGATLQTYAPVAIAGQATLQRNPADSTPSNNILWERNSATPGSGNTINVAGPAVGQESAAFGASSLNLNVGTDNIFANTGNGAGNNNNIERADFVFSSAVTASSALSLAVFERGQPTSHDGFKIAAILATDGTGKPTQYGMLLAVTAGSWGTTSLGALNTTVFRNNATEPGADATHPSSSVTGQALGGVAINIISDLAVPAGTPVLGYSLFAADTNSKTAGDLLDVTNTSVYPINTPESAGGLDLAAYNGVLYMQVPEPSSVALTLLAAAGVGGWLAATRRARRVGAGLPHRNLVMTT